MANGIFHDDRPDVWEARRQCLWLRQKAGLTQRRLGAITGVSTRTISRIENAHRAPWQSTWVKIATLAEKHNRPPIVFPAHWD
jgi:DNA-binding XRE family transcriptional regulator